MYPQHKVLQKRNLTKLRENCFVVISERRGIVYEKLVCLLCYIYPDLFIIYGTTSYE